MTTLLSEMTDVNPLNPSHRVLICNDFMINKLPLDDSIDFKIVSNCNFDEKLKQIASAYIKVFD